MSRRSNATPAAGIAGIDPRALIAPQSTTVRVSHRMVIDVLALLDIGLVIVTAVLAKLLYVAMFLDNVQEYQPYLVAGFAGGVVLHYVMRARGLLDSSAIEGWSKRVGETAIAIGLAFLVLIAIAYLLKISASYSRGWLLTWLVLTMLLMIASRPLYAYLISCLATWGYTARRIAVVGTGPARERVAQTVLSTSGLRLAGSFCDTSFSESDGPDPNVADLIYMGQRNEIDEVVIALSDAPNGRTMRVIEDLSVLPVDVWFCPAELHHPILDTTRLGTLNLLRVKLKPLREWGSLLKLVFDYVAGGVSLIVFAPLMLLIALAIKIDSPGPVLFRQRRHGFNHRVINVYKFRTMWVDEDGRPVEQARRNDPRVTRVGNLLRRTSLDELPQLINVMRGEMSLVGPRPHALEHNHYYRERLDRYGSRHRVKPGLTGWAQIHGLRGPTDDPEKMRRRVQMDLYYVENWSFWLDLKIIAATPFVGFVHRNAF
jgi:putative colanic acid biosynthesis UDP-glucose lipid carrier transferase